jgi:mono/diheme cytochrome c family protein
MNMRHRRRLRSPLFAFRHVTVVTALLCGATTSALTQAAAQPPAQQAPSAKPEQSLSADDVSWLFPAPTKTSDLASLIAIGDLTATDPQDESKRQRIWSDAAFQQFLAITASPAAVAGSDRIALPAEAKTIAAWHIASVRFDPGAPGLSDAIISEYGQSPQIRLVLQPVVKNADDTVTPLDMTAHLVFNFTSGIEPPLKSGCFPRPVPDLASFKEIVAELAALRSKLRDGELGHNKIVTAGKVLGVHPGLIDQTTQGNVRAEMKAILERHLSAQRLGAMAIMGLPDNAPEPWIFLSMQAVPPGTVPQLPKGGFVPVHGPALDGKQFAELLQPAGSSPRVVPEPHTNNLAPITCINAAAPGGGPPIKQRKGVATADLPADPVRTAGGKAKVLTALNTIADPTKSHFFNTDCVSCHTETRRALELLQPRDVPKIAAAPLPNGPWNVRNFGWSPLVEGDAAGTVSRRTAAETKAVVDFINAKLLPKNVADSR